MRTEVYKFGGTSVGSAERMAHVAELVGTHAVNTRLVVVSSAMTKVTDQLVAAAAAAAHADRDGGMALVEGIRTRHHEALAELGGSDDVAAEIDRLCSEAEYVVRASVYLGEVTARARDRLYAMGEKLAVRLLATALRAHGLKAVHVDADTFLETDDRFGEAEPLGAVADRTIVATLGAYLDAGVIPVVTGFVGRAPDGATTTLGRGGSDFTATLVAAALRADEVTIWTDVPGVFTTDPRVVPGARVIPQLHYREAAEMSYYGAKVLHQRTMIPVAAHRIPVRTRDTFHPELAGTTVDGGFTPGSHPVKAITAVKAQSLLAIEGKGMAGVPGVAASAFRALAERNISVTMISQSSSESSITLVVPADQARDAEAALKGVFRPQLSRGDIEEVVRRDGVALVAAVGLGMANTPGVAARVFRALARERINVLAIAQGSSELNISLSVEEDHAPAAIRVLHAEFGLDRLDTGADRQRGLDILLLGCGNIGRAFVEQVLDRSAHVLERFELDARVVALCDRTGFQLAPEGFTPAALTQMLDAKRAGTGLGIQAGGVATDNPVDMVNAATEWRLANPVLVDVSDASASEEAFLAALRAGCDVATANKKPLASSWETWKALAEAQKSGAVLRKEATVGAGLPVVDTLEMLLATGDQLTSAEGSFSGTLGYIMSALEAGERFSAVVRRAVDLGYTEPDPVVDLSGVDVARKAIILGRVAGLVVGDLDVELEGLVPDSLSGLSKEALFAELEAFDAPLAERVAAAHARGERLRFVARVEPGRIVVGPREVPAEHALGGLKGTDNMIVFTSERYADRPLVVAGPGAGIDVTAMGVLGDVIRIAAERR